MSVHGHTVNEPGRRLLRSSVPRAGRERRSCRGLAVRGAWNAPQAGEGTRTPDLPITNRLLYQLSYSGEDVRKKVVLRPADAARLVVRRRRQAQPT